MTLHIVNNTQSFSSELCAQDDVIVLIENGVYADLADMSQSVYVIQADRKARGLDIKCQQRDISYDQFVALCTEHSKVVSW